MGPSLTRSPLSGLATLAALLALFLTATPVAAQEEDPDVECDEDFFIDEDDDVVYFLFLGGSLGCLVTGLDLQVDAVWEADFYDLDDDSDDPFLSVGDDLDVDGDGNAEFEIDVPTEPRFLWMEAVVVQGDLEMFFYGTTDWAFEMACEPDPVELEGSVECMPEELTEGEFLWYVIFFDESDEELPNHEIEGEGTADAEGVGAFAFDVPADESIVSYLAVAEQPDYLAEFEGTVVAAQEEPPAAPTPQPTTPAPVAVPQPTRVDTGAGGSAPDSGAQSLLALVGLAAAGAIALRRLPDTTATHDR